MTNDDLLELGFTEVPNFNIMNAVTFDLGRRRQLSAGDIGTPNEMVFLCEVDEEDPKKITDLICVHNYDYDGFLTKEKVTGLLELLATKTRKYGK